MATMVLEVCIPERCWIAPEIPNATYSRGETVTPVCPTWVSGGAYPASTAARDAPTAAPSVSASCSTRAKSSFEPTPRPPETTTSAPRRSGGSETALASWMLSTGTPAAASTSPRVTCGALTGSPWAEMAPSRTTATARSPSRTESTSYSPPKTRWEYTTCPSRSVIFTTSRANPAPVRTANRAAASREASSSAASTKAGEYSLAALSNAATAGPTNTLPACGEAARCTCAAPRAPRASTRPSPASAPAGTTATGVPNWAASPSSGPAEGAGWLSWWSISTRTFAMTTSSSLREFPPGRLDEFLLDQELGQLLTAIALIDDLHAGFASRAGSSGDHHRPGRIRTQPKIPQRQHLHRFLPRPHNPPKVREPSLRGALGHRDHRRQPRTHLRIATRHPPHTLDAIGGAARLAQIRPVGKPEVFGHHRRHHLTPTIGSHIPCHYQVETLALDRGRQYLGGAQHIGTRQLLIHHMHRRIRAHRKPLAQ